MSRFSMVVGGACLALCSSLGMILAEEAAPLASPAPAAAATGNAEADALEVKCLEWFKVQTGWPKDSDPQEVKDKFKAGKKETSAKLDALFDLKIKDVSDAAKADGYKAKKSEIVANNLYSGMKAWKTGSWSWDFEAPADPKIKKGGKKK